jgi:DNA polymerase III delta prime subunit
MTDAKRIETLLAKLANDKKVSLRDLKAALGDVGVTEYEDRWKDELDRRSYFDKKPDDIKKYEAMVHEADFLFSRAEGMTQIGKRSKRDMRGRNSRTRLAEASETKYELAIEYLQELIDCNESLRVWFDRDLDFDAGTTTLSNDCDSIARTVTSKSIYKQSSGAALQRSKAGIKREMLEVALERCGADGVLRDAAAELTAEQSAILKGKLAKLKRSGR